MTTVWQVAAGASGREYSGLFLKHGLMFLGGEPQIGRLKQVSDGDLVLLKSGVSEIIAVGQTVERDGKSYGVDEIGWLSDFDGWDLSHFRCVEWHCPPEPIKLAGLNRGTLIRSNQPDHRELAKKILSEYPAYPVLPPPAPTRPIKDDEIIDFLIELGLRPRNAEELTYAFRRVRSLARFYYNHCEWEQVREHETRSFLILPLLFALGWAEQQMKIELGIKNRRRIDIACFEKPFLNLKNRPNCRFILESKGFASGLKYGQQQATAYADQFPECPVIIVSNGYCYKVYRQQADKTYSEKPSAYLNLLRQRDKYPLDPDNVDGALEVFRTLLP